MTALFVNKENTLLGNIDTTGMSKLQKKKLKKKLKKQLDEDAQDSKEEPEEKVSNGGHKTSRDITNKKKD